MRRSQRVADLVRAELAEILHRRTRDPRIRLASVSDVDMSPDLRRAVVKISVMGDAVVRAGCLRALRRAKGFIRAQLARNLRNLRVIPDLVFELDRGPEYSQRIEQLLEQIDDGDRST
jgi:ribosome-binding factor A